MTASKGHHSFSAASSNSMASALVREVGTRGPSTVFAELAWVTDTNAPETAMTTTVTRIMQVRGTPRGRASKTPGGGRPPVPSPASACYMHVHALLHGCQSAAEAVSCK